MSCCVHIRTLEPTGLYGRYSVKVWEGASPLPQFDLHVSVEGWFALALAFDLLLILMLGPPNHCRITGTPSLGEVPSVGAKAFWLLLGSFQK